MRTHGLCQYLYELVALLGAGKRMDRPIDKHRSGRNHILKLWRAIYPSPPTTACHSFSCTPRPTLPGSPFMPKANSPNRKSTCHWWRQGHQSMAICLAQWLSPAWPTSQDHSFATSDSQPNLSWSMGPINEMIHLRDIWKKAQHWNCYVGFCLSMVRIQLVTTTLWS